MGGGPASGFAGRRTRARGRGRGGGLGGGRGRGQWAHLHPGGGDGVNRNCGYPGVAQAGARCGLSPRGSRVGVHLPSASRSVRRATRSRHVHRTLRHGRARGRGRGRTAPLNHVSVQTRVVAFGPGAVTGPGRCVGPDQQGWCPVARLLGLHRGRGASPFRANSD